jgi:hypothetical protein
MALLLLLQDALVYCATAYLSAVGQEDRAPLVLKGLGIGPKATFSYDELDVGGPGAPGPLVGVVMYVALREVDGTAMKIN